MVLSTLFRLISNKIKLLCVGMFPKSCIGTDGSLSALSLFSVNAFLPLEAPPVLDLPCLICQILEGGFRSRRAGSCGWEIV